MFRHSSRRFHGCLKQNKKTVRRTAVTNVAISATLTSDSRKGLNPCARRGTKALPNLGGGALSPRFPAGLPLNPSNAGTFARPLL